MKFEEQIPPREYTCGFEIKRIIKDFGRLTLEPDEQITFIASGGAEYDVCRKDFGFYATPSTNGRLARFGLRAVLCRNRLSQLYLLLVQQGKEDSFQQYLAQEQMHIVIWLDTDESVSRLLHKLSSADAPKIS